uniref:Uncharacterized protein n=1 Tax=Rousettus aegyptiacus TaxID=9407 RepID=A0A7J8GBN4_ROUAE|nr:hypothetical protein HJG63_011525 [Rousettus aegyptiacus]
MPLLSIANGNIAPVNNNLEWKVNHWNSEWIFRILVTASDENFDGLSMYLRWTGKFLFTFFFFFTSVIMKLFISGGKKNLASLAKSMFALYNLPQCASVQFSSFIRRTTICNSMYLRVCREREFKTALKRYLIPSR